MRMEDIKNEFPQMPDELKERIRREVELQVRGQEVTSADSRIKDLPENMSGRIREKDLPENMHGNSWNKDTPENMSRRSRKKHKNSSRRMIGALLAATLAVGTTAIAGTQLYRMYTEKVGKYGVKTTVEMGSNRTGSDLETDQKKVINATENTSEFVQAVHVTEAQETAETVPAFAAEAQETAETVSAHAAEAQETAETVLAFASEAQRNTENARKNESKIQQVTGEPDDSAPVVAEMQFGECAAQLKYLPEGMIQAGTEFQFYYEEKPWVGGLSFIYWKMDSDEPFEMLETSVTDSEEIECAGHDGIYMKQQVDFEDKERYFDKIVYVAYPEVQIVLGMHAAQNVSKEEALKVTQGIRIIEKEHPGQEGSSEGEGVFTSLWSDYLDMMIHPETEVHEACTAVSKEALKNTHEIGEEFPLPYTWAEIDGEVDAYENAPVTVRVSDVQILDDSSVLNLAYMENLQDAFDPEGNLLPNTIKYFKIGDGVESLDELIAAEQEELKLVYVTTEYTNRSDVTMENILFFGVITKIEEKEDKYVIYDRAEHTTYTGWDRMAYSQCGVNGGEMMYYDVHGGESNGTNYIDCLEPGETQIVHFGFLVHEDELPYLYLNLSGSGGVGLEFWDSSLELGYVDIRQ